MPENAHNHEVLPLFESAYFRISSFKCAGGPVHGVEEEVSGIDSVVFPLAGFYVRRLGGGADFADMTRALFFRKDDSYLIDHPKDERDTSLVVERVGSGDGLPAHLPSGSVNLTGYDWLRLANMVHALESAAGDSHLLVDETLISLLGDIQERADAGPLQVSESDLEQGRQATVRHATAFINEHYRDPISVHDISVHAHTSPWHLCRLFQRQIGTTLHQYVLNLRLREALDTLARSDASITDIAYDLGFSSHSHFTDKFRRQFGMTPGAWRRDTGQRLYPLAS